VKELIGEAKNASFNRGLRGQLEDHYADFLNAPRTVADRKIIREPMARAASFGQRGGKLKIHDWLAGAEDVLEDGQHFFGGLTQNHGNGFAQMGLGGNSVHGGESVVDRTKTEFAVTNCHTDRGARGKSA